MLHKKDKTLNKSDFKRVLNCEIFITIVNAIINQVLIKIPTDVADKKNKTENSSQLIWQGRILIIWLRKAYKET